MSVYTKLNRARMALAKRKLEKTGHNKFAGYKYFELGDFIQPAQEIFDDIGLCGVVSFAPDIATLTITDTEDNSQIVITSPMGSAALKGVHEVQNIGAVETYQRRYLWVAALEIVEHDALDASEPLRPAKEESKLGGSVASQVLATNPPISDDRKGEIERLAKNVKSDFEAYGAETAYERIELEALEDIEKIYLSTLLPANIRNPITAHSRSLKKAKETA
jgi:hypothetical protein